MQTSVTHSHQRSFLTKYKTRITRLQKAIQQGTFTRYSEEKKRQLFQCLARYEKRLQQWGIAVATGTFLLLPANNVSAQTPLPVGNEFRVNTYTAGGQYSSDIAVDSDGDFVISWQSRLQDGSLFGIYAQRYDNAGVEQGTEFRVNTYTNNNQNNPSVAVDSDGDFVISWNSYGQDGNQYGIYAQRYNNAGVAQGSEFMVNTYTALSQGDPSVAMDIDGDFVISWESRNQDGNGYGIYAQRYNNTGTAQGAEFRVNTYTALQQSYCSIAMESDGEFVIIWTSQFQDGSSDGIYAQRYTVTCPITSVTYYADADGDGYGNPNTSISETGCAPAGYVLDNTDCDDTNAAYSYDRDWYYDGDGDGYYSDYTYSCAPPVGAGLIGSE